jgi:hypothetical protein
MRSTCVRDHSALFGVGRSGSGSPISLVWTLTAAACLWAVGNVSAQAISPVAFPGASGAQPPRIGMDDEEDKWLEQFIQLLKRLYEILGGDPAKLSASPNAAMSQVSSWFLAHGVPENLTPTQIAEALSDIQTLTTMLHSPPSSVDPGNFPQILAEIAAQLG